MAASFSAPIKSRRLQHQHSSRVWSCAVTRQWHSLGFSNRCNARTCETTLHTTHLHTTQACCAVVQLPRNHHQGAMFLLLHPSAAAAAALPAAAVCVQLSLQHFVAQHKRAVLAGHALHWFVPQDKWHRVKQLPADLA